MDPSDLRSEVAEKLGNGTTIDAATFNAACFLLSRELERMELAVPDAGPLVRRLLRVAGRVVIDMAGPAASPDVWPNTETMALQWIDEALAALGYRVMPGEDGGRPELRRAEEDWA